MSVYAKFVTADRSGVEIGCCPQGGGIWLDQRALNKFTDRSVGAASARQQAQRDGCKRKKRCGS